MAWQMPYAGGLGSLQRLVSSLEANRADLGHLEASLTQLGTRMDEALRLATLLRAGLRQRHGIPSEKLAELGAQPFRGRTRKTTSPAPVNPEPPAPADPSPTTPAVPSR
jgi:hypothetical protein